MKLGWTFGVLVAIAFILKLVVQILKTSWIDEGPNFRKIIKETPSKLSTKALKRANKINKLNAGTPHDWEDYEKYLEEEAKDKNKTL